MLTRDDYDYGVEGFYRPFNAIASTKPIVIIDEPHRFSRDQKLLKLFSMRLSLNRLSVLVQLFQKQLQEEGKIKLQLRITKIFFMI